jgi:thioesterase domain-containing protein
MVFRRKVLDGNPIARTSVEAIAAYYLEEMRKVQPHGPYLGGYSFGGVTAYEIARHPLAFRHLKPSVTR